MGVRAGSLSVLGSVVLAAAGAPLADVAPRPITGTLSKPGYTVIALASNGKARSVRARTRRLRSASVDGSRSALAVENGDAAT